MGRPAVRHWSARCTPTRSACSACTPPGTAIRRLGCWPAPSRTRWSATCWAARSKASPGIGLAGADRACAGGAGLRRRAPPAAAACRRAGARSDELAEVGARHEVAEWAAAGRFFRCYERSRARRGGRGAPQATAPALDAAELVAAALDALAADPELLAAERERVRHLVVDDAQDPTRSRWSWWACSGAARAPCAGGRPRSGRPDLPRRRSPACRPSRWRRWCAPSTIAGPPRCARPVRRSRPGGRGEGRQRVGPPGSEPEGIGRHWPSTRRPARSSKTMGPRPAVGDQLSVLPAWSARSLRLRL